MSTRRSLVWTYLAQALSFFVTFASTIVVARIVTPRDFGIFAMATAVATIINVFMQFGLAKYLMREEKLSTELLRSVFTVNLIMTLIYVVLIVIGAFAAGAFQSPEVRQFLLVFALFPIVAMMEFIPAALCAREMRFGTVALMAVMRAVVLAIATLVLALNGYAYMSFAWAQVIAWIATSVCFNIVIWKPEVWRPRLEGIRSIFRFGAQMIGITGISQLSTRAGEMTLGAMLGLTTLGLYNRASGIPASLYASVYSASSNVIFSRLSRDLLETGQIHQTYLRFMRLILGFLWPVMLGLAVLAQPLVNLLYGPKWAAAAVPLSFLAAAYAVTIGIGMTSELFILRHQTQRQVKLESVRSAVGLALFAGGAMISLPAAAAAKFAEAVFAFALYQKPIKQMLGESGELRGLYIESLWLSIGATLPCFVLMCWTDWSARTSLSALIACTALGGLIWAVMLIQRRHPIAMEVARFIPKRL